ncbi:Trk system potassium transporter TrkA [Candidatus Magnetaquicoccus inordinatus]|uniref:Trk system potassium transporter TrkA n=1 Tax=Candidatus Magnetaquicoccus inordinatus TaxID=2496818 RepID=UPI00102BF8DE|nr:Trk system potassium transporter TrkA [Candidatus Magnetaquicoccus inordinatus]
MNILIAGATPMGGVLAKYMVEEGHDVHVVDANSDAIAEMVSHLDVRALVGEIQDPAILTEVQIQNTDLILAVSDMDTTNIVTALALHPLAPRARTAVWVRDTQFTENTQLWSGAQLDQVMLLTPERNALHLLIDLLEIPLSFEVASFMGGKINIAGFCLHEDSPLIGKKLSELVQSQENRTLVAAVERGSETIVPTGDFIFAAQDRLFIPLLEGRKLSSSFEFMGLEQSHLQMKNSRYLLGGGGRMSYLLARRLEEKGISPIIIEQDRQQGKHMLERLSSSQVLQGDVTNLNLLSELITPATTYIALTGNQEINFLSSVLARRLGAGRAITIFDNEGYMSISQVMGVDAAIHPKFTTIGQVMGLLRRYPVNEAQLLLGGKLDALLVPLQPGAPIVGKQLRHAGVPKGVVIAAHYRDGQLFLPDGNSTFNVGDQLLFVSNRQAKLNREIRKLLFVES